MELLRSKLHATLISDDPSFEAASANLRQILVRAVEESKGDSILLSGGLDTSIVGAIASKKNPDLRAFTVALKDFPAPDVTYSRLIASRLGIRQELIEASLGDVEEFLPKVIAVLRSFDPMEIRNSLAIYFGLTRAKSANCSRVLTGDAADELFAGYSFVMSLPTDQASKKLHHLWEVMRFSSIPLASSLGIEALLPFLDSRVKEFATIGIPFEFLVNKSPSGDPHGKFILRKTFEDSLPSEITWRKKTPIEYGSGTTQLPRIYSGKISDTDFLDKKRKYLNADKVRLRDKEQLHYYEIYRSHFGPPTFDSSRRNCPACTSNVDDSANFCTTCGEYPI